MSDDVKFTRAGLPDGRGRSEGSRAHQFSADDGRRRPGRPKGSVNFATIVKNLAAMPVTVTIGNRQRKVSTAEAIMLKQRQKALAGEQRPAEKFIERLLEVSPTELPVDLTAKLLEEDAQILAEAVRRAERNAAVQTAPSLVDETNGGN